jgi:hypothetical protein
MLSYFLTSYVLLAMAATSPTTPIWDVDLFMGAAVPVAGYRDHDFVGSRLGEKSAFRAFPTVATISRQTSPTFSIGFRGGYSIANPTFQCRQADTCFGRNLEIGPFVRWAPSTERWSPWLGFHVGYENASEHYSGDTRRTYQGIGSQVHGGADYSWGRYHLGPWVSAGGSVFFSKVHKDLWVPDSTLYEDSKLRWGGAISAGIKAGMRFGEVIPHSRSARKEEPSLAPPVPKFGVILSSGASFLWQPIQKSIKYDQELAAGELIAPELFNVRVAWRGYPLGVGAFYGLSKVPNGCAIRLLVTGGQTDDVTDPYRTEVRRCTEYLQRFGLELAFSSDPRRKTTYIGGLGLGGYIRIGSAKGSYYPPGDRNENIAVAFTRLETGYSPWIFFALERMLSQSFRLGPEIRLHVDYPSQVSFSKQVADNVLPESPHYSSFLGLRFTTLITP